MIATYETFVQFNDKTGELTIKLTPEARKVFLNDSLEVPQHVARALGEADGKWRQVSFSDLSYLIDKVLYK